MITIYSVYSFFSPFFSHRQIMSVVIKTSLFNLIGLFVVEAMNQFFILNKKKKLYFFETFAKNEIW